MRAGAVSHRIASLRPVAASRSTARRGRDLSGAGWGEAPEGVLHTVFEGGVGECAGRGRRGFFRLGEAEAELAQPGHRFFGAGAGGFVRSEFAGVGLASGAFGFGGKRIGRAAAPPAGAARAMTQASRAIGSGRRRASREHLPRLHHWEQLALALVNRSTAPAAQAAPWPRAAPLRPARRAAPAPAASSGERRPRSARPRSPGSAPARAGSRS